MINFNKSDHVEVLTVIAARAGWSLFVAEDARLRLRDLGEGDGGVLGADSWPDLFGKYLSLLEFGLQKGSLRLAVERRKERGTTDVYLKEEPKH